MPATINRAPIRYLVSVQAITTLLSACGALMLGGVFAYSVLLGGLLSLIPNAGFASLVFRHSGARAMGAVVRNAYMGELMKLVMIGVGFGLVFVLVDPLHVLGLFTGFVVVHMAGLVALIRHAGLNS
ncbi:MAG: ATP synthase subunit I [Pseudomonadota bacterium]|nr:ATP synthase subunit I [Pseudomonadota bacterium]